MKEISREEYLNALEVIDLYHSQKQKQPPALNQLKIGDVVKCVFVSEQVKTCLTLNKEYVVTKVINGASPHLSSYFCIRDDNRKTKKYSIADDKFQAI